MQLPCLQFGCIMVPFCFILKHLVNSGLLSCWQSAEKARVSVSLTSLSVALMAPWRQPGGGEGTQACARSHRLPWAQATMPLTTMGSPCPQDPPRSPAVSEGAWCSSWMPGLLVTFVDWAVRNREMNYSSAGLKEQGSQSWRFFWLPDSEFPRAFGQAVDSVVLGDSCSESYAVVGGWPGPGPHAVCWYAFMFGL